MKRRALAFPIRLKQEAIKRVDRYRQKSISATSVSLAELLDSRYAELPAVLTRLRAGSPHRLPIPEAWVAHRLDGHSAVTGEAERILEGFWNLFNGEYRFAGGTPPWRRHPKSGAMTPLEHFSRVHYFGEHLGGDVKYIWELNRHGELLRLAQAYHLTGESRFAARVVELIEDWISDNPPFLGINWVSALEVAFRSIAWCWIWRLTAVHPAWTDDRVTRFLHTLSRAGKYLVQFDSIHHSPNTHLTGEAIGLLYIASSFPELKGAAAWRKRAIETLTEELEYQFLADGFHFERCTGYHRYNVEFYLHALAISRQHGESWGEAFVPHLKRALDAAVALRRPDGEWPVLGDEDGGCALHLSTSPRNSFLPLLGFGAALLGDSRWVISPEVDNSVAWWFSLSVPPAVSRDRTHEPAETVQAYSLLAAGYHVFRSRTAAGKEWFCTVDAGPHGGSLTGHAHTDVGHIELSYGDTPIILDPGSPVYGTDRGLRDWSRSLEAHACLSIDEEPLAIPNGPFGWKVTPPPPSSGEVVGEGFAGCWLSYRVGTTRHVRMVALLQGVGLVVVDWVLGSGRHDLLWNWPLARAGSARLSTGAREVTIDSVRKSLPTVAGLDVSVVPSVRARIFGEQLESECIRTRLTGVELPVVFATTFTALDRPPLMPHSQTASVRIHSGDYRILLDATPGEWAGSALGKMLSAPTLSRAGR